jgi:tetratricopeptide (TPR) repeat protein
MPKTFTLISLGYRGVGKTVFLASNCAEILRSGQRKSNAQKLWFECPEKEQQDNIEKLVDYIVRTGKYPPPTFKVSDFNFSLKGKGLKGDKTLANFSWLDIPGEWCDLQNSEFQSVLLQSHGCCVFIDAYALLHTPSYTDILSKMITQLEAIGSLVTQHNLKYPIALICTKCDLIDSGPIGILLLEEKLMPLTQRLDSVKAYYRRFYSAIPLVNQVNGGILKVKDATAPLLWLISELRKLHGSDIQLNLGSGLDKILPSLTNPRLTTSLNPRSMGLSRSKTQFIGMVLGGCAMVGTLIAIALNFGPFKLKPSNLSQVLTPEQQIARDKDILQKYESILQKDPANREAIAQVVNAHSNLGQYNKAIALVENALQTAPNDVNILLELAGLYTITTQDEKAEKIYDRILKVQKDNLFALTGKATILSQKGDLKSAKKLFEEAKKYALTESQKAEIDKISKEKLKP